MVSGNELLNVFNVINATQWLEYIESEDNYEEEWKEEYDVVSHILGLQLSSYILRRLDGIHLSVAHDVGFMVNDMIAYYNNSYGTFKDVNKTVWEQDVKADVRISELFESFPVRDVFMWLDKQGLPYDIDKVAQYAFINQLIGLRLSHFLMRRTAGLCQSVNDEIGRLLYMRKQAYEKELSIPFIDYNEHAPY